MIRSSCVFKSCRNGAPLVNSCISLTSQRRTRILFLDLRSLRERTRARWAQTKSPGVVWAEAGVFSLVLGWSWWICWYRLRWNERTPKKKMKRKREEFSLGRDFSVRSNSKLPQKTLGSAAGAGENSLAHHPQLYLRRPASSPQTEATETMLPYERF